MGNKSTGTQFERDFCKKLAENGWWVHFLTPNGRGAQPFDVLAIKDSSVVAVDCKTCAGDLFPFSRIEDNQRLAFDALLWKTDAKCGFAILYNDEVRWLEYSDVKMLERVGARSVRVDALPLFAE